MNLTAIKYCVLKAESGQFVTSSYPALCGNNENISKEDMVIYFPIHPQFALLYSDSLPRKSWNRIVLMPEGSVDLCNKRYYKLSIEQARFIYAQEKKI